MAAQRKAKAQSYDLQASPLYALSSKRRLAQLIGWTGSPSALARFAQNQRNYRRYMDRTKPEKPRLVEAPLDCLKAFQKSLEGLLKRIRLPTYVHSGVPGRSYLSNSAAHRDAPGCTITLDITSFFQSVSAERVTGMFVADFKCKPDVALVLANLACCDDHLATGSPASPILSYMAHMRVFDAISERFRAREGTFTLYMDDIAVTGLGVGRSDILWIAKTLRRAGLEINHAKTRTFRARKPKVITGRALCNGVSRAPHRQHLKMRLALAAARSVPTDDLLRSSAVGRMRHVALLDDERRVPMRVAASQFAKQGQ